MKHNVLIYIVLSNSVIMLIFVENINYPARFLKLEFSRVLCCTQMLTKWYVLIIKKKYLNKLK